MMGNRDKIFNFWLVLAGGMLLPALAHAQITQANTIGDALTNASTSKSAVADAISSLSFVTGAGLTFWGLLRIKQWADGQSNLGDGLWRIVGGTFMFALPNTINSVMNSLYGTWDASNTTSSTLNRIGGLTANTNSSSSWIGLDQAMINLVVNVYGPAKTLTTYAGWAIGMCCIVTGIYRLAQAGQAAAGRAPAMKGTVGFILGGALLVATSNIMDTVSNSIFGSVSTQNFTSLYYSVPGVDQTRVNNVAQALFAFVEIVGWIAFVRGIYLLVKLAQGGGDKTHAHAFSHIVFGAAAVNMYPVVLLIQKTIGMQMVQ